WVPGAGEYIDASGRSLALPEAGSARALTKVDGAALVHDPAVLGDPLLSDSVAAAARLAAANARLHAALTAQVDELEASRRRLLAAADDERRRLEQRLRDGVERRLAALADRLERDGTAGRARELLARTRADLRELARGLHPTSDTGLAGALAELAGGSAVPVELAVADGRVDAEAEAAAYFVCAEALANATKHAAAGRVVIAVRRDDARLTVEVADDGAGGADAERGTGLRGLADRLEARGGRLLVDSPAGGGTRLVAEIPLSRSSATA
ncbi:MAG TPA: ATP-binding protein, partial [Solirubrobacter sp.]|nr:ATP-binding protein [Solirubrobacter sp.]